MKKILFLLVLGISIGCSSKINQGVFGNYQIVLTDYKIDLYAFMINPKIKKITSKYYYSFHNNQVIVLKGNYFGKLLHGEYKEQYFTNRIKSFGKFHKGLKDGKWIHYHPNSQLKQTINYNKGDTIGPVHFYNSKGELTETIYNQKQTLVLKKQIEKSERKKTEKAEKAKAKENKQNENKNPNNSLDPAKTETEKRKVKWPKFKWFNKDSTSKSKN